MFTNISCPACKHKFSVPEGAMGKRQNCPNCQSYFVAGKSVADVHPNLAGFHEKLRFVAGPEELLASKPDAIVLALPHKEAASQARRLLAAAPHLRIVDLSGDHRLADPAQYETHYGAAHPHPEELTSGAWIYGLPEANRDAIRASQRVANPGCFATGAILAVLPLARRGLVAGPVRHVAITGSSGSGAEPSAGTHHPERVEKFFQAELRVFWMTGMLFGWVLRWLGRDGLPTLFVERQIESR